jgi:hypothetical protein
MSCEACEGFSRPEDQTGQSGPGLEMLRRLVWFQSLCGLSKTTLTKRLIKEAYQCRSTSVSVDSVVVD